VIITKSKEKNYFFKQRYYQKDTNKTIKEQADRRKGGVL